MGRLNDWPERLNAHVDEWRNRPFEWGKSDCALFCLHAEKAITGESRFEDFLGAYDSDIGSIKALKRLGAGDLISTVGQRLEEIPVSQATRGDVASIDTPEGDALSLVIGDKVAGLGKEGLLFFPLSSAKKAWRV